MCRSLKFVFKAPYGIVVQKPLLKCDSVCTSATAGYFNVSNFKFRIVLDDVLHVFFRQGVSKDLKWGIRVCVGII